MQLLCVNFYTSEKKNSFTFSLCIYLFDNKSFEPRKIDNYVKLINSIDFSLKYDRKIYINKVTRSKAKVGINKWKMGVFGARARVLASLVVFVVFSTAISLVAIRQLLWLSIRFEIEQSLKQEIQEFRRLREGINPSTGEPFGDNIAQIFDVFLLRNVPNEDEFLITLLDGKFYKSSHTARLNFLNSNPELIKIWSEIDRPSQDRINISVGHLYYWVEPIKIKDRIGGVFVVARLPARDYEEINRAVLIVGIVEGFMGLIALASSLAWLASGQILVRLRLLTETAKSISSSDLNQRIPVQGKDEITELTVTFNEMLERLESSFTSQQNFINDAGHELRTPITIIRCYLEQLNTYSPEEEEALTIIKDELTRMSRLVEELLLLVKAKHPNFLHLEIVSISAFTEELYGKVVSLARRNWCLESRGSGRFLADSQRLTQAALNLVQNAIQNTTESDVIAIGSQNKQGYFHFWVRDTGKGIEPVEQERIFERFARGKHNRYSEGFGLGLAIVRAIAQAHGGFVELDSEPGQGSTFTIIIPLESGEGSKDR